MKYWTCSRSVIIITELDIFLFFYVFVMICLTCLDWIGASVYFANLCFSWAEFSLLSLSPKPQQQTISRNNGFLSPSVSRGWGWSEAKHD